MENNEHEHPYHERHPEKPPWHYEDRRSSLKDAAKASTWTVLLGVLPVFALGYTIHSQLLDRLSDLESRLSTAAAISEQHLKDAERWKDRIQELERESRRQRQDTGARPDPWTGTDGRADRNRIDKLEREVFGTDS